MTISFPFGLTYLVVFAVGGGIGAALVYAGSRIFGKAIFHPFELLDAAWYMRRLFRRFRTSVRDRWWKRRPAAGVGRAARK